MSDIADNIALINAKIKSLSKKDVLLLAVSKTQSIATIKQAFGAGQRHFGENYLQEASHKITQLAQEGNYKEIVWHFIGSIQANKTTEIAKNFSWIHSVDRLKIAKRLNDSSSIKLNICLQVNIDDDYNKSGLALSEVNSVVNAVEQLENINLRGFMCIPKQGNSQYAFAKMVKLINNYPKLDILSMGMSEDIDIAIKYGANIVRVGRAIFGERKR